MNAFIASHSNGFEFRLCSQKPHTWHVDCENIQESWAESEIVTFLRCKPKNSVSCLQFGRTLTAAPSLAHRTHENRIQCCLSVAQEDETVKNDRRNIPFLNLATMTIGDPLSPVRLEQYRFNDMSAVSSFPLFQLTKGNQSRCRWILHWYQWACNYAYYKNTRSAWSAVGTMSACQYNLARNG